MQTNDLKSFTDLLSGVMDLYGREVSPFSVRIWWEAMQPYDLPAVSLAFSRHVQNPDSGQFVPKPADVIRMLGGTTQDKALQAWAKVDKAVRHVGTYQTVAFDDPLIHRVLHDMGGWVGLGMKTEDEWPFVQKEFENRYRGFSMRNERPEYPQKLIGISEAENSRSGKPTDPARLIGDATKALAVMSGGTDRPLIGFSTASEAAARPVLRMVKGDAA